MSIQLIQSSRATKLKKTLIAQTIAAALIATPFVGFAAEEDEKQDLDDVIVVTAQKRTQNVMKVPVTVDSISAETIKQSGSILLSDIDKFIPGFDFGDGSMTQSGVSIRGVSSPGITVGGDPSAATFFDNVYMPRAAQNVLFSDMQRIEVLKGPQGTLFGKNAAMGVVNIIPNAPQDEFESFVKGSFGTDNLQRIEGMVNFSLADNVYLRANLLTNEQDGFVENISRPEWNEGIKTWDSGAKDHTAARVAIKWDMSDRTNFQVSYDYDDLEQAPPQIIGLSEWALDGGRKPFSGKVENDVRAGVEKRDMSAVTFKANHEFDDQWSMMFVSSFREWETVNRQDEDGTGDPTRYFDTSNNEDSDIFYNELQFNYNDEQLHFVGGLTYSKEDVAQTTEINTTAATAARLITTGGGGLNDTIRGMVDEGVLAELQASPAWEAGGGDPDTAAAIAACSLQGLDPSLCIGTVSFDDVAQQTFDDMGFVEMDHIWNSTQWAQNLTAFGIPMDAATVESYGDLTYDQVAGMFGERRIFGPGAVGGEFGPGAAAGMFASENINNTGEFTSIGIYADVDYYLTPKWNVFAGLRYSEDEKDFTWEITPTTLNSIYPGISNIVFPALEKTGTSKTWDKITGRIGTGYQINDNHMVFASYSTGYKAGGFDSLNPNTAVAPFAPEETANIELGYKGLIFNSVRTILALYHTELDNRQRGIDTNPPNDGVNFSVPGVTNENLTIDGIEIGIQWEIIDTLTAGIVTDYRETDVESEAFYNGAGDLVPASTISDESNTSYTLTMDWMPDLGLGNTKLHLDYVFIENARGLEIGNEEWMNDIPNWFDDTKNLNARMSWVNDSDNLEIGLWGKNLLDNQYIGGAGGLAAGDLGTQTTSITRGLEAGIDIQYSF